VARTGGFVKAVLLFDRKGKPGGVTVVTDVTAAGGTPVCRWVVAGVFGDVGVAAVAGSLLLVVVLAIRGCEASANTSAE
jgi:hypothetical protein